MSTSPGKPLRVLFHIVDFGRGGTETALIGWLRALPRDQFVVGLSIAYPTPEFDEIFRAQLPPDIPVHILHDHPVLHTLHSLRRAGKLGRLGRLARTLVSSTLNHHWSIRQMRRVAVDYDVVVDFDLTLRRIVGKFAQPFIGINHFSFAARLNGRPKKIARLARQYHRYAGIGVLNDAMAAEAQHYFGDTIQQVMALPNAVDIDALRRRANEARPSSTDARYPWERQRPYLISVARLDEAQKDHESLIAAFAKLVRDERSDSELDLVIAGDGPDRERVMALAQTSGVNDRIFFMGYQTNPHCLVAGAQCLVLSSRYEGLPMVVIEALALGKAVVCSDCPTGPREALDNGQAGILVPPGDADALCAALSALLHDAPRREALGRAASARAQFYGTQASAARLRVFCQTLMLERSA